MDVIGEIPEGSRALRGQTVGIDGGAHGPRVGIEDGKVLENNGHTVAVVAEYLIEQGDIHAGAEGALEVVVDDDRDGAFFSAAPGASRHVDARHVALIRVLGEIKLGDVKQLASVSGDQKIQRPLHLAALDGDRQIVIAGEVAGSPGAKVDLRIRRDLGIGAHLALNAAVEIGSRGGGLLGSQGKSKYEQDKDGLYGLHSFR